MAGREHEPDHAEEGVAGAAGAGPDQDEEEARDDDQGPLEVARVPPEEQGSPDRQPGGHVHPEAVRPRIAAVQAEARHEQQQADEQRDRGAPVAAAREDVGDEVPAEAGDDRDEEREAEEAERGSAAISVSSSSASTPRWKPLNGPLPVCSHPNHSKNAPTMTAKSTTATNAKRPAASGLPLTSRVTAAASATTKKRSDQPAKAPLEWSAEITDSQATAARSAISAPVYARNEALAQPARTIFTPGS